MVGRNEKLSLNLPGGGGIKAVIGQTLFGCLAGSRTFHMAFETRRMERVCAYSWIVPCLKELKTEWLFVCRTVNSGYLCIAPLFEKGG